jgi:hypothetical protein
VKTRFQSLPFKFNLQRYTTVLLLLASALTAGLYKLLLNPVDT